MRDLPGSPPRPVAQAHRPARSSRVAGPLVGVLLGLLVGLLSTGCGGPRPVLPDSGPGTAAPTAPPDPWGQLAARVAAAQDKRYVATYTLRTKGRADRTVTVTVALDGSWLVSIPAGALGGSADVAIADTTAGLYQCLLGEHAGCVRVGDPTAHLPRRADPRLEHLFTDWLRVLTDRQAAIAVDLSADPPGTRGECFSVEPNSASLASPVDPGIYCYDQDGTLTGALLGMGTVVLAGAPGPAPKTVTLPAPVVPGDLAPTAAPPPSATPDADPAG